MVTILPIPTTKMEEEKENILLLVILTMLTIHTTKVEEENMDRPLQDLPQIQIPLTRPQDTGQFKNWENNYKEPLKEESETTYDRDNLNHSSILHSQNRI